MTTSGSCFMSDEDERTYNRLYGNGPQHHSIHSIRHTWKGMEDAIRNLYPTPILTKTEKPMTPFEIKVMIPVSKVDIYEAQTGCLRNETAIVSVEKAKQIYDAIGRQLKGLKATEPKAKAPKKKPVKKTAKKK